MSEDILRVGSYTQILESWHCWIRSCSGSCAAAETKAQHAGQWEATPSQVHGKPYGPKRFGVGSLCQITWDWLRDCVTVSRFEDRDRAQQSRCRNGGKFKHTWLIQRKRKHNLARSHESTWVSRFGVIRLWREAHVHEGLDTEGREIAHPVYWILRARWARWGVWKR